MSHARHGSIVTIRLGSPTSSNSGGKTLGFPAEAGGASVPDPLPTFRQQRSNIKR